MKIIPVIKHVVVGSVPLLLVVGCGGGGSGGDSTVRTVNLAPATITTETAHEAVGVGLMLDDQLWSVLELTEFADLASGGISNRAVMPQEVLTEPQPKHSKTNVLGRINKRLSQSRPAQGRSTVQLRSEDLDEVIPCDEGSIAVSGDESRFTVRFNRCAFSEEWSDGDSYKEMSNGSVIFSVESWSGYAEAYRVVMDLNVKFEEVWYGEPESGDLTLKGAIVYGANSNKIGIKIDHYDLIGKGKDVDGPWDVQFWIRDFSGTSNLLGSKETVTYKGKAGGRSSEANLDGTLEITTDSVLRYDFSRYSEFAFGDGVKAVGANGDVLRVVFDPSGTRADVCLNGDHLKDFYSFDDFECWAEGGC